jgi:hypothetical protein
MTRYYDEDDARVQADRLRERNRIDGMFIHKKGKAMATARRDKVSQALRDTKTTTDIAFKAEVERRARKTPITLPKVGG